MLRTSYDANELILDLSRIMASTIDVERMSETVLSLLAERMNIQNVSLFLYAHDGKPQWFSSASAGSIHEWTQQEVQTLRTENSVRNIDTVESSSIKDLMTQYDVSFILPLTMKQFPVGYLFFGKKPFGESYSKDDIQTLHIIGPQFAIALKNALQYSEIKAFSETLKQEIEKATAELRVANKKLQDLDQLKDEFLLVTSHNLRTPMTTLMGYTWILLKRMGDMSPDSAMKLKRIYNCSQHMIALINDMLDVSRIEAGRVQLVLEEFDIVRVAKDVQDELKGLAEDKSLQLIVDATESYMVRADRNRTHEILVNLISNAIKFTDHHGEVRVLFRHEGNFIITTVSDTGIGIAKDDMSKLFHKYGRVQSASLTPMPQASGTGLGLYICKKIIELSGGTIRVDSTIGKGSVFTFTLPAGT